MLEASVEPPASSQSREEPAQEHAETAPSTSASSWWSNPSERLSARAESGSWTIENVSQANFRHCEVALLDHHPLPTPARIEAPATGCFETHVSALTPPQSISTPVRKTSVVAPSSRTPRKKVLYVRVLFGSPET